MPDDKRRRIDKRRLRELREQKLSKRVILIDEKTALMEPAELPESPPERCCFSCGKEFTDPDLGCEFCDQRCPGFGGMG